LAYDRSGLDPDLSTYLYIKVASGKLGALMYVKIINLAKLNISQEWTINIWLKLIVLTLLSASVAEADNTTIVAIIAVCMIVVIKGHWIINDFMGLKNASALTRRLMKLYLYTITCLITLTSIYSHL
jgi:uncharacterized protein (DUF362 family)